MYTGEPDEEERPVPVADSSPQTPPPGYTSSGTSGQSEKKGGQNEKKGGPREKKGNHDADIPLKGLPSGSSEKPSEKPKPANSSSDELSDSDAVPAKVIHHFRDAELAQDLVSAVHDDLEPAAAAHARHLNGFFSVLALCHTVLTNINAETGKIEYKAQSPDEAALVQAAADMGFVFRGREREILYLQTPFQNAGGIDGFDEDDVTHGNGGKSGASGSGPGPYDGSKSLAEAAREGLLERYELLNILEFTSARKRMSVVLRKLDADDGRLFLLSKGADNVIFERLRASSAVDELKAATERHLDDFASQGLRTLTLAYKVVDGEFLIVIFLWIFSDIEPFEWQNENITHGVNGIMKRLWPWTIVTPKSRLFPTSLNKTLGCLEPQLSKIVSKMVSQKPLRI